ncbi:zinc finger, CCHC-type containing protein [Tanacetum coccineum]
MDVKTTFLNGKLDEEVYMNQPQGFIMLGNENKVCKLIKSLYGLKKAPKQWHQKFDEVVLSIGYLLNQTDKYMYSKFDKSGKGFIIYLYIDDMPIFGTDQVLVDMTKEFLSSKFSMKDIGEDDVILSIRIKHKSNKIVISKSYYIEKVLKKFSYFDCTLVSTPMDTSEKLIPNNGQAVSQLKYSWVMGCLMHAMTCTRPDNAFVVGKLSSYPSVLEGYTDASWSNNTEDTSSTSGWVFLLSRGVISWASKKQTCITGSTMKSKFMALAAAGKEAECAATLAKAYSQMYIGKSRHLGVRHSMIRELIMNRVEVNKARDPYSAATQFEGVTKPDTFRPDLKKRTAFTAYSDPQGVIYEDQNNRNRLMRTDELHKFSDGTLNSVRTAIHDFSSGIRMDYLPKRKWSR